MNLKYKSQSWSAELFLLKAFDGGMIFIPACLPKWQQVLHQHKQKLKKLYTELEIFACNKSTIVVYAGIDKYKQTLLSLWWLWDDEDISLHIYQGNKRQDEA